MTKPIKYRLRVSGSLLSEAQLREYLAPVSAFNQIFLPVDSTKWDDCIFELGQFDPVYEGAVPVVSDPRTEKLQPGEVVPTDAGHYLQMWEVVPRYESDEQLAQALRDEITTKLKQELDRGIVIDGIPVKTDAEGIARLNAAPDSEYIQWVAHGSVWQADPATVAKMKGAVQYHVQACYARAASLLGALDAGNRHLLIDEGWP